MKKQKTLLTWINKQAQKLDHSKQIYCMGPCGIGCGIDEARSVYKHSGMPPGSKTIITRDKISLMAPLRDGGMGTYFKMWNA